MPRRSAQNSLGKLQWSNDGRSLVLDPDKMASRIIQMKNSSGKHLLYWPSKLFPKAGFPTGTGSAVVEAALPDLLQGILDAAQNARREANVVGGAAADFVNSCLKDAKIFLRITNQFRLSDQTRFLNKKYLSGLPEGAPFSTFFQDKPQVITKVDGVTPITAEEFSFVKYEVIDWDKTWLASQASTTPEQRDALELIVEAYGHSTAPKDVIAKIHQDVIGMQAFSTNLINSSDLQCRSPPKKREITSMEKRKLMHLVRRLPQDSVTMPCRLFMLHSGSYSGR